jgi:formate C-acetyltransferase
MEEALARPINSGEMNGVNVLTDRVKKRKDEALGAKMHVCSARMRLWTQSWKETEEQPTNIRIAKALQKVMEEQPIVIRDGELIVGSQTKYIRGASPALEYSGNEWEDSIRDSYSGYGYRDAGTEIAEEDLRNLLEDMDYWKDKSVAHTVKDLRRKALGSLGNDYIEARLLSNQESRQPSAMGFAQELILKKGLSGIVAEARKELTNLTGCTADQIRKVRFLEAAIIALEAATRFAERHAELARDLAKGEDDSVRKQELQRIAEVCEWVPAKPARTFQEALQSIWFAVLATIDEGLGLSNIIGRLDQYLYPFYENDIREGRISRQQAAELLGCFWIKMLELDSVREINLKERSQGSQFVHVTIGGVREDGRDAANELSLLILEVARQLKVHQPHITFRYHDGVSQQFFMKALETTRDIGAGIPQFKNDNVVIPRMLALGIPLEDARNCESFGCSHETLTGRGLIGQAFAMNSAKAFELALNNGIDPRTGKRLGLETGDPRNFGSFDELLDAFKKQFMCALQVCAKIGRLVFIVRGEKHPRPFLSAVQTDGIKKARDIYDLEGGAPYDVLNVRIIDRGHQDIADSMVVIKKLVFEENKITMAELLDALAANFEGREDLRQMCLAAPKWGNDDDEADQVMKDVFEWTAKAVESETNAWGKPLVSEGRNGTAYHVWAGKTTGALPNGRLAWTHLADGGVSPMTGVDTKGPTAVINSVTKLDLTCTGSAVFNQKFPPGLLQGRDGIEKLSALTRTYFEQGGLHIQFNVLDRETLLDAKEHPKRHRHLLVRVAGYSARFVDLAPELQDEIISRTEQVV